MHHNSLWVVGLLGQMRVTALLLFTAESLILNSGQVYV